MIIMKQKKLKGNFLQKGVYLLQKGYKSTVANQACLFILNEGSLMTVLNNIFQLLTAMFP